MSLFTEFFYIVVDSRFDNLYSNFSALNFVNSGFFVFEVFVNGKEIAATCKNNRITSNDITLQAGVHRVVYEVFDTNGNVKKYCNNQICPLFVDDILMVMSDLPNGKVLATCYLVEQDDLYTLNHIRINIVLMN